MVGFVSRVLGEIKKASKRNTRPLSPVSRLRMKLLAGGPEAVGEKQAELDSTFLRRLMMREPHTKKIPECGNTLFTSRVRVQVSDLLTKRS